jgi:hypothetical protein
MTYVASFSECGNLLSQWRAYCPSGGFSIGFDYSKLETIAKAYEGSFGELVKCIYREDDIQGLISNIFKSNADKLVKRLWEVAPRFKHYGFSEEREWRLVLTNMNYKVIQFRERNNTLIPYWPIALTKGKNPLPVCSIVTGPTLDEKQSQAAVELLLHKFNLYDTVTIESSHIPYRQT